MRLLRATVQRWPIQRGRGKLIDAWRRVAPGTDEQAFDIGGGALAHLELDDHMVQLAFVGDHARDLDYRASLGLLESGSVVIDVGANIGLWSLAAARRIGSGRVHGFEPSPRTFARLERNIELNAAANVTANQLAVDREGGTVTFYEAVETNSGGAGYLQREGAPTAVEVDRITLDTYCRSHGIADVGLIKLDIEGAEWLALQGAEGLLTRERPPALFMELDGNLTRQLGWEPEEVLSWLGERGYRAMNAAPSGELVPVGSGGPARDVFALHESSIA